MALLTLSKTQGGDDLYLKIKTELLRIYSQKPCDSYKKALTRQMTGLPSQLGYQIINDICKKPDKLNGCCCEAAALALWSMNLPVNIRAHISNMTFTKDTYKTVFEAADQVFLSSKQVTVAAMSVESGGGGALNETLPAFTPQNQPQVAAIGRGGQRGGRGGKNNRGGRGGQRNQKPQGQQSASSTSGTASAKPRGPRHASGPPDSACDRHYRHGDQAFFCLAPLTCPWVSKIAPRP